MSRFIHEAAQPDYSQGSHVELTRVAVRPWQLVPEEMMGRIGALQPTAVEPLSGAEPYSGDKEWFKDF